MPTKRGVTRRRTPRQNYPRRRPIRLAGKRLRALARDEGPEAWFLPVMEESYAELSPRGQPRRALPAAAPPAGARFVSTHRAGAGESALAEVGRGHWRERLAEFKERKAAAVKPLPRRGVAAPARATAPAVPGGINWLPLGPSVVLEGQTVGSQPVAGRVSGVAIAPGGQVLYVATASGGVFRSDDGGTTWRSLMDGFDLNPADFASASLACGAIAIDSADPDRVYVGTGEGDTHNMFRMRIVNALPAYRGIGPIRSDDGGATWKTEPTASGSPDLAGDAFFALAVDPRNREHVVAATTLGLYHRVPVAGGGFEWTRRRPGVHSSVVVAQAGGTRRFFAAEWSAGVLMSANGAAWSPAGTGLPTGDVGRIALAVQPDDPDLVYALLTTEDGALAGLYRLDAAGGSWKKVQNLPDVLPGSQGTYDLAIAVDPQDRNRVYLGGDRTDSPPYPGSVWRCVIAPSGGAYRLASAASIGTHAHADIHVLVHTPGDPDELWCGCDGGLFLNRDPRGQGQFASQNDGLSCLCSNFIAQHPTDPNILFTGLQDNGTARTAAGSVWTHVNGGDGGYCLINWANPRQVLVFANGTVYRSTSGGASHSSWSKAWDFPWATMTQPIVGTPYNPATTGDAKFVAVGAGPSVFVSSSFAASWEMGFDLPPGSGSVFALAFASTSRLFIGTTEGEVFRADRTGTTWTVARLDSVVAGPLGLSGLITDVAVDWADPARVSVYVTFGGVGDRRRVWRFDGARWEPRSGSDPGDRLLDVEHNALVVDPLAPEHLYVGADIGVWHSADAGRSWSPFENGLPDAPVFDLQMHPTRRLLRAATHGRGVYEISLDAV